MREGNHGNTHSGRRRIAHAMYVIWRHNNHVLRELNILMKRYDNNQDKVLDTRLRHA